MPIVKQWVRIAIAVAMAFMAATAFGISSVQYSAPQVKRFTPSKADFRLDEHQRLKGLLGIELRPR
jgi:hypothetical protein